MKALKTYLFLLCSFIFLFSSCSKEYQLVDSSAIQLQDKAPVPMNVAQVAAANFNQIHRNPTNSKLRKGIKTVKETLTISDSLNLPAYYIINYEDNMGWVIVSAEKKIQPILAFSDEGNFSLTDLNPGVQQWMKGLKAAISIYRSNEKTTAQPGSERAWEKYTAAKIGPTTNVLPGEDPPVSCNWTKTVPNMLTTQWGQGYGYNDVTPTASGGPCGHAVTGCVATAMAQVMYYHKYPSMFSWSEMPYKVTSNPSTCSPTSGEWQIAFLMGWIGNTVNMDYGATESGANPANVVGALINNFHYGALTNRSSFNWQTTVSELDAARPVILDGGTHMWVCSGYQQIDIDCSWQYLYLWMNWGWDGNYRDGYYAYNNWAPSGYDFNSGKSMTVVRKP